MDSITITLPLPAKELSPNYTPMSRGAGMAKARKKKEATQYAWAVTLDLLGRHKAPKWKKATLQAAFYWPTMGFPDDDNAMGSLKAYRDGIALAGVVTNDKVVTTLPWTIAKDKTKPRVEITITKTGEK